MDELLSLLGEWELRSFLTHTQGCRVENRHWHCRNSEPSEIPFKNLKECWADLSSTKTNNTTRS